VVSQAIGQLCNRCGFVAKRSHGNLHPPAREVSHGWLADQRGESRGERRPRHVQLSCQRDHSPVSTWIAVNQCDRPADLRVPQRAKPSHFGRRVALDPGADRLDDDDVRKPREDRLAAYPRLASFRSEYRQSRVEALGSRR
jgi:hypothetical protein